MPNTSRTKTPDVLEVFAKYRPDCECFRDRQERIRRQAMSTAIAQAVGSLFGQACREAEFCPRSLVHVLDDAILNIATICAIQGTIIECASVEAERETVRILSGMEARLIEKIRSVCAGAREQQASGELDFPRMNGRGEIL